MGNKIIAAAFGSAALLGGLPATGYADHVDGRSATKQRLAPARTLVQPNQQPADPNWRKWNRARGELAVPELDPGAAGHGVALLLAATALLFDRRRTQRA